MNRDAAITAINGLNSSRRWSWQLGVALGGVLAIFLVLQCFLPLRTAVLIGADEGFEVGKATLLLKDCKLYTDIWNDQPPLHTFLLAEVLSHAPSTMLGPRLLTSAFAVLLLSSMFVFCWCLTGGRVATMATLLLLASPGFFLLASSCMLEIPALGPTMPALAMLALGNRTKWPIAEVVAGVLLGMAIEIKLISLIILPIAVLLMWTRRPQTSAPLWSLAKSLLVLIGCMAISTVTTDVLVCHGDYLMHFRQSWASHFGGMKSLDYGSPDDHRFDWMALIRNWDLTLPAVLGVAVSLLRVSDRPSALVPVAWIGYNLLLFGFHRPWWNYYYVHTAITLSWCAAIGIDAVWSKASWPRQRLLCVVLGLYALCVAAWLTERMILQIQLVRHSPQTYTCLFLNEMQRYKGQAHWLYAEEPMYSFHAGIPLVPDLAVVVAKRFWSGEMTDAQLTQDLEKPKPELILLKNNTQPRPFRDLLNTQYRLVYMDANYLLYVLKSIARPPGH